MKHGINYWKHVGKRITDLNGNNIWYSLEKNANNKLHPRILSLGCGYGGHELALSRRLKTDYEIIAIDLNENVYAKADGIAVQEKLNIKFKRVDLNYVKLPSKHFDFIFSQAYLHHIINLEHLFEQINEALTDYGEFYITDIIGKNRVILWEENHAFCNKILFEIPERFRKYDNGRKCVNSITVVDKGGMEGVRQQELYDVIRNFLDEKFAYLHDAYIRFLATHHIIGANLSEDSQDARDILDYLIEKDDKGIETKVLRPTEITGIFTKKA